MVAVESIGHPIYSPVNLSISLHVSPWFFDQETVDTYRTFVNIHYSIAPYLYTTGNTAYAAGVSIMKPLYFSYYYLLGDDIFVAPFVENGTMREITFPEGGNWVYWFDHSVVYPPHFIEKKFNCPITLFPAFRLSGSIIPMYGVMSVHAPLIE